MRKKREVARRCTKQKIGVCAREGEALVIADLSSKETLGIAKNTLEVVKP